MGKCFARLLVGLRDDLPSLRRHLSRVGYRTLRREPGLANITGANILLVVEVADSSLSYDLGRKAALYASFGVRELWVIDALKMTTRVFRKPSSTGYDEKLDVPGSETLTPAFAPEVFSLKLDELELV